MNKKYTHVLFDLDDTLFDLHGQEAKLFKKVMKPFLTSKPSKMEKVYGSYKNINECLWQDLEKGKCDLSVIKTERFKILTKKHNIEVCPLRLSQNFEDEMSNMTFLVEGAESICQHIKKNDMHLSIITNGYSKVQRSRLQKSPLKNYIDDMTISEDHGYMKPDKRIFEIAFKKIGAQSLSQVLIVGDRLGSDILGGNLAGIHTCWMNPNNTLNTTSIKPTYTVDSLKSLEKIV